jgi:preprotein translocase subunit SecF
MYIIRNKNVFFTITALIVAASLASIAIFGLHLSIDFTGGTLAQISYNGTRPTQEALTRNLTDAGFKDFSLRQYGANGYTLRAQTLTDAERGNLAAYFTNQSASAHVDSLNEIGPTIGTELRNKSLVAMGLVLLCILFFIAFVFRKVSKPVSSWVYGLIALVTLLHDVIVPVGFFALLGYLTGAQVDTLFVTAVLTVLGFSIHDTIVVFDRVRENLRINQERGKKEDFQETAGRALNQTFVRSINTSLTVLITLLVLYFVGPGATKDFALTLLVGIIGGTYSSIFLATPLLVWVEQRRGQRGK